MLSAGAKTRQQVEHELLEVLNLRQREWISDGENYRDLARHRFMQALREFNDFVLDGRAPKEN